MLIRLIVPGERARVEDLNASLEAVLARHGISQGVRGDVRLIVEELASNAIAYGGIDGANNDDAGRDGNGVGQHELSVHIAIDGDLLTLEFRDQGAPFDPLSLAAPDLDADIMDRPLGGLGLYLIRQIAEETHYRRIDDANLLRVSLRIATPETLS
ncbi:MAG: ATP-binding protein [Pseudoxanthomonas sp.]